MSNPYDPNNPYQGQQPPPQGQPQYQGPQYPQGQQPGYQPPPPMDARQAKAHARGAKAQAKAMRPFYKKKRFILPALLIGLPTIIGIAQSGGDDPASTTAVPAASAPATTAKAQAPAPATTTKAAAPTKEATKEPEKPKLPGIGDKVDAGTWAFTVTNLKCGIKKVGDEYLDKKAQGQFCKLSVTVANNGDSAEYLTDSNQFLLDKKGRQFSADSEATLYEDSDNSLLSENINPGNSVKGSIFFDIPKDAKPTEAKLAGGFFGVKDVATIDVS